MVLICDTEYPSNSKYESNFELYPYPLSSFQKYAIEAILEGQHVLVTAHTGSGKTLPAEFAIQHFAKMGKKVIYTSPIKALSNQKYYEFSQKYPTISFGLFTGDIKTNPDADVLIMTTEILMNYLFTSLDVSEQNKKSNLQFQIDIQNDLACVIFDEVHYINDVERGQVWEKTILMLPQQIQMIMLSATIDNPVGFAEWCERGSNEKIVYLASTNHRVVPLSHYGFLTTTEAIFKQVKDKELQQEIRDMTNKLIPLQTEKGSFQDTGYRNIVKMTKLFESKEIRMKRQHVLNQLALFLRDREMLPAIVFVFSRKNVELCAKEITVPLLEDDSKVSYIVRRECEQIIRKLPNFQEYLNLPEYNSLVTLLERGIGIHHSGMIPILREIVELMISKKYIKMLFATESFAIGLDCPIRTAVFTSLTKFDGNGERYLMSHEYTQMAGRAGRRGIDTVGYVVHCNNLFPVPSINEYKSILGGIPQKLVSKYRISYSLILNLLKNGQTKDFHLFSNKSMIYNELLKTQNGINSEINDLTEKINKKIEYVNNARTPRAICEHYIYLESTIKTSVNKKRKDAEKQLENIKMDYRYISDDLKSLRELIDMENKLYKNTEFLEYNKKYIESETAKICKIMIENGFIEKCEGNNDEYSLTLIGNIASNIAEIHPLVISKQMIEWDYFKEFSPIQLIGLFSCFTDIKIPFDMKLSVSNTEDLFLKNKIENITRYYHYYNELEIDNEVNTGIRYDDALNYDIVDFSMKWCECQREEDCKIFIHTDVADKEISIGDFTKAMLKIVTIAKELMNVCEIIGEVELLHKLNQIDGLVLKYVTTSQSLYV
uniref:Helicase n=1 Tax=viral metagenome TaxID=1070528 RepID=A0A6C0D9D5_9ZZZZ